MKLFILVPIFLFQLDICACTNITISYNKPTEIAKPVTKIIYNFPF